MRILLVEDDTELAASLADELRSLYSVDLCIQGACALTQATITEYDLIILDLGLPDMSGFDICLGLRKEKVSASIMILTGQSAVADKVKALNFGADDYLVKPFHSEEMLARVRALLRRGKQPLQPQQLQVGILLLDRSTRNVFVSGELVILRRKEFDLLEYLLSSHPKIVTRQELLDHVWDSNVDAFTNAIDVHISHLRKKIGHPAGSNLIETVYGFGYRINSQ